MLVVGQRARGSARRWRSCPRARRSGVDRADSTERGRTTGTAPRAMTTSSPASASAISLERLVLASCTERTGPSDPPWLNNIAKAYPRSSHRDPDRRRAAVARKEYPACPIMRPYRASAQDGQPRRINLLMRLISAADWTGPRPLQCAAFEASRRAVWASVAMGVRAGRLLPDLPQQAEERRFPGPLP